MLRWIVEASLNLRYFVIVIAVGVIAFGITQLGNMPVDVYPEFNPPLVEIQTEALGLSAVEVEALLTVPLEADLLNGVAWLDQIYSESVVGLSSILLVFEPGTDPIRARQMVQERLTQTFALPNVSKPPTMLQPLSTTSRVMMVGISSDEQSLIDMGVLARWIIKPRLMGVPGVANVAIWGQREWQLQVQVEPDRLQEAGVTLDQIIATTGEALWVSPLSYLESSSPGTAGWIDTPNQRLSIRHILPISSAEEMGRVPVKGTAYRLGDVTDIVEDHQPLIGDAMLNDGSGLLLVIEKFPGANTLEVTRGVEEALNLLSPGLGGIEIDTTVFRPASYFEQASKNLTTSMLISLVLIILALVIFLFDWRMVIIGFLGIFTSVIAAASILYLRGETFNIIILGGLAAALGIVLNDALTGVDNMQKRLREHRENSSEKPAIKIIIEASSEIRSAVSYTILVIILIVLPMFFLQGINGAFFRPLAVSYLLAVVTAQVVTLIIIPAFCLVFFSKTGAMPHKSTLFERLQRSYHKTLSRALQSSSKTLIVVVVVAVLGLVSLPFLRLSLLPEIQQTNIRVQWEAAPGTSLQEMNRIMALASAELREIPGVINVGSHIGRAITGDEVVSVNSGEMWLNLAPGTKYSRTLAIVQTILEGYPGFFHEAKAYQPDRIEQTFVRGNRELVVRIYGHEFDVLNSKALEVQRSLQGIKNIASIHVDTLVEEPQVEIEVDLAAAERFQIKPGDVRRSAATLLSGLQVGNLYEEQKVFDVIVWGAPEIREDLTDIEHLLIDTPRGGHVLLSEVADIRIVPTANIIKRDAVSRFIDVRVALSGRSPSAVAADIDSALDGILFPLEYHAEVLSDYREAQENQQQMIIVIFIVVIGSFLLIRAAFRNWHLAFFTVITWPIALVGGVIAVFLVGRSLSLGSLLGLLLVLGVAIRNGVILIDHYHRLIDVEGMAFGKQLILLGASQRLRSILMTNLASGLAFAPFLFAGKIPGHELLNPMAVAVVGGLISSTLIDLFLLPILFLRFGERRRKPMDLLVEETAN